MRLRAAAALTLTLVAAAPAAAAVYQRIALKTAYGETVAEALVTGTASSPKALYVSTRALPAQKVTVTYALVCTRGALVRTKAGHHVTASFAKRKLALPLMKPGSCTLSVGGRISQGGQVTVRLYQR